MATAPPTTPSASTVAVAGTATAAAAATTTSTTTSVGVRSSLNDPNALLDTLDTFRSASTASSSNNSNNKMSTLDSRLDTVEFLNRHYTTESLLTSQLPLLRTAVENRMDLLEERISTALQRQSETSESTRKHVVDAKQSILHLEQRIRLVQSKASQSERAVLEITKDMKRLDCAKRHLQKTITTLKRLHMLVHGIEQLRLASLLKPFPDYKAASQLIDATRLLLQHFRSYQVQKMKLLDTKVQLIQQELKNGLIRGFRIVGFGHTACLELETKNPKTAPQTKLLTDTPVTAANQASTPSGDTTPTDAISPEQQQQQSAQTIIPVMPAQVLTDGTVLIDALGDEARYNFIATLVEDYLLPYQQLFRPKPPQQQHRKHHSFKIASPVVEEEKPPYALEQVERRFAWYRRILRETEEKFPGVFPAYWNFYYQFTVLFLNKTKSHLLLLLDGNTRDRDCQNATILLKALQKTILFEKEMMALLQRDFQTVFLVDSTAASSSHHQPEEELEFDDAGQAVAANSAQGIRIKYERQKKKKKGVIHKEIQGPASSEQVPVSTLVGVASSAFNNYMGPYIELEEQSMDELLVESLSDPTVDSRGELPVFTSSTGLFVYIKGSITRCTAMSKSKAFFLLFQAFQDSLRKYAQVLTSKLPQPTTATTVTPNIAGLQLSLGKQDSKKQGPQGTIVIPQDGEVTVCHVISTCEYCVDTIEALEDLIRDTIDAEYKEKVDMNLSQEAFHDVTAKSISVLVSGLMNRCDDPLRQLAAINWSAFDMVGDESSYVRKIISAAEPFCATVRGLVPSSYFRSFCDKFAMAFTSTYYNTLVKFKRISEQGSQQLLLDVNNLKSVMLKLPVLESKESKTMKGIGIKKTTTIAPAMYTKMVTKQFKRIETTLKLVGTPAELLIDVFRVQWPGGSALDLQTVMALKGMKRTDQAVLLEKFGVDPVTARAAGVTGEAIVAEHMVDLRKQGLNVAQKVNSDLVQMRQKVDDFRKAFR